MDKKTKTKWLKALRSGKYKQGMESLSQGRGEQKTFCCLGVLCDVLDVDFRSNGAYLPRGLGKKVGLDKEAQEDLANKNDGRCGEKALSFKQIANFIEKHH